MIVETNLPEEIAGFEYVKNHHYIRLTDRNGNSTRLGAVGLLEFRCTLCGLELYMKSNHGNVKCPACQAPMVAAWGRLEIGFVAEAESDFHPPMQSTENSQLDLLQPGDLVDDSSTEDLP